MTNSCCMKKRLNSISLRCHRFSRELKRRCFAENGNNKILSSEATSMKLSQQNCGKFQGHGRLATKDKEENTLKPQNKFE